MNFYRVNRLHLYLLLLFGVVTDCFGAVINSHENQVKNSLNLALLSDGEGLEKISFDYVPQQNCIKIKQEGMPSASHFFYKHRVELGIIAGIVSKNCVDALFEGSADWSSYMPVLMTCLGILGIYYYHQEEEFLTIAQLYDHGLLGNQPELFFLFKQEIKEIYASGKSIKIQTKENALFEITTLSPQIAEKLSSFLRDSLLSCSEKKYTYMIPHQSEL